MSKPESQGQRLFGLMDYLLFVFTFLISSCVGVYHAWRGAGSSTSNYLMGGRKMGVFPIAMSLAASTISATTMLGVPTDTYLTGTMYVWVIVSAAFCIPAASYLYLPVFHRLGVVSANQYLELRFNRHLRRMASFIYVIKQLFFLSIVVFGPSLALHQVTGIELYVSVTLMFVVCTFYTSIGGIKAVVWTDTIQIFVMYGSIVTVLVKGVSDAGGFSTVWERNLNSSRIEIFNFELDFTTRHTVWSLLIGGFFYWTAWYGVEQTTVQRFLAMPTLRRAQVSMWANLFAVSGIILLCGFFGLVIYGRYFDCDPVSSKLIEKADQIVPLFVMDTVGSLPGLSGLFLAGIFSGALSSLSSGLNAVALVVLEDFVRPSFPTLEDHTATKAIKGISLLFGCVGFGMVFLVSQVETILDALISFDGAAAGSVLGVFTLGMFVPLANCKGASVGLLVSFSLMMWLGVAAQMAKSTGVVRNGQMKRLSTENCPHLNQSSARTSELLAHEDEDGFSMLRISFWWYTVMGMMVCLIVGTLVSLATEAQDPKKLNPKLVCRFIGKRVGGNVKDSENPCRENALLPTND